MRYTPLRPTLTPKEVKNSSTIESFHPTVDQSLESFMKKVPGRKQEPRDVDDMINPYGDLNELVGIDVIVRSVQRIFLLEKDTYPFDPEIGVGIHRYVFEPADEVTRRKLDDAIRYNLSKFENRAKITHNITFFSDRKGFRIDLIVEYSGKSRNVSIVIDETLLKTAQP